jgi:hypothetical protein
MMNSLSSTETWCESCWGSKAGGHCGQCPCCSGKDFNVSDPNQADVALLAWALAEAEQARRAGVVMGPAVGEPGWDQVGWSRAVRRATRRDLARLRAALGGVAA